MTPMDPMKSHMVVEDGSAALRDGFWSSPLILIESLEHISGKDTRSVESHKVTPSDCAVRLGARNGRLCSRLQTAENGLPGLLRLASFRGAPGSGTGFPRGRATQRFSFFFCWILDSWSLRLGRTKKSIKKEKVLAYTLFHFQPVICFSFPPRPRFSPVPSAPPVSAPAGRGAMGNVGTRSQCCSGDQMGAGPRSRGGTGRVGLG